MLEVFFLLFILLLLSLPFFPGWLELLNPRDNEPLYIDLNSSSDPRCQAMRLAHEMQSIAASHHFVPGIYPTLEILNGQAILDKKRSHPLYAPKKLALTCAASTVFGMEEIVLEKGSHCDAAVCEGPIYLKEKSSVKRMADGQVLYVDKECRLGELASAKEAIYLQPKCLFKRLYAPKIVFVAHLNSSKEALPALSPIDIGRFGWYVNASKFIIPAESQIHHNVYSEQDLRLRHNVSIEGSIQCQGKVYLSEGVVVKGNIFAKDAVVIGRGCTVLGNIFSQNSVTIDEGTAVGESGKIKSVIAKKEIKVHAGVTIYGYVMTEGQGYVV